MSRQLPEWPSSLPIPIEMRFGPRAVHVVQAELSAENNIMDLVHDLFWFPNDNFYLFVPVDDGVEQTLYATLEGQGIELLVVEMHFYPHPHPAYKNDFTRILPHEAPLPWQHEALQNQMYKRFKLTLEPATRTRLSHSQIAAATRDAIANAESIFEAKPNIYGIGINFNSLLRKVRNWFQRKV